MQQTLQLIELREDKTLICSDYILDYLTGPTPILPACWEAAARYKPSDAGEKVTLIGRAISAEEEGDARIQAARRFYNQAIHTLEPDLAAQAMLGLAQLEASRANYDMARAIYLRVIELTTPKSPGEQR